MKPVLVSGIQPTGKLHLGNYLGALRNFVELQNSHDYSCLFFIADLHSLTLESTPKEKREQINDLFLTYLAAGLDPKKSVLFQQSAIAEHSELAWILNTITPFGELRRMTQFKEKAEKVEQIYKMRDYIFSKLLNRGEEIKNIHSLISNLTEDEKNDALENFYFEVINANNQVENSAIFNYPVLMSADILLYNASVVPVGDDQLQHLELTRTLARKFNSKFGKTFIEPKPLMTQVPRLMSLNDPEKKMSKSLPEGCLFLDDEPSVIRKKISRAVTDSESTIEYNPENRPGISNLILIYSAITNTKPKDIVLQYRGLGYAEFKKDLGDKLVEFLLPIQEKKMGLKKSGTEGMLESGNSKAKQIAEKRYTEIKKKVGLI